MLSARKYQVSIVVVLVLIIAAGLFYWFQLRPANIYTGCSKKATEKSLDYLFQEGNEKDKEFARKGRYYQVDYEDYYNRCLRLKGVNAPDVN
jgi:hypothetical protein